MRQIPRRCQISLDPNAARAEAQKFGTITDTRVDLMIPKICIYNLCSQTIYLPVKDELESSGAVTVVEVIYLSSRGSNIHQKGICIITYKLTETMLAKTYFFSHIAVIPLYINNKPSNDLPQSLNGPSSRQPVLTSETRKS